MSHVRRILFALFLGALVGAIVATPIAASLIPWYNTPATGQALCSCAETAHMVVWQLVRWQLIGAAIGAVVFMVLAGVLAGRRRRHPPASTSTPPTTP